MKYLSTLLFLILWVCSTSAYSAETQSNVSGSNTSIEGGYTGGATTYESGSTNTSTTSNSTSSNIRSAPPTANAPSFSATYEWQHNSSNLDSVTNLGPGTYYVIITDEETGCPIQDSAVITEPEQITFNPTITNITCNTFTDGAIILDPSGGNGGIPNYDVNWYGQNNLALGDGIYTITVSDPATITTTNPIACANDTIIYLNEPLFFSVDFTIVLKVPSGN